MINLVFYGMKLKINMILQRIDKSKNKRVNHRKLLVDKIKKNYLLNHMILVL